MHVNDIELAIVYIGLNEDPHLDFLHPIAGSFLTRVDQAHRGYS